MPEYTKDITLPSRGLFYEGSLPDGSLKIRSMTTMEEKLLAAPSSGSGTKLLDNLYRRCAKFPDGFGPSDMILFDRLSLMFELRVISYGQFYKITHACSECNERYEYDIDLQDFIDDQEMLNDDADETHDVELPVMKKIVTWRYLTGKDEAAMDKQRSRMRGADDIMETRTARQIVTIDGETLQLIDLLSFVRALTTKDNVAIRDSMNVDHFFGINPIVEVVCKNCKVASEPIELPWGRDFFRITSSSRKGYRVL